MLKVLSSNFLFMETQTNESASVSETGQTSGSSEKTSGGQNTAMAVVAYVLFFVPLLTDAKDDPFVKYHVKQGFVLFLTWVALSVVAWLPPILFVSPILHLGMFVFMIIGIMHALNGKKDPLPLIGQFADKFNF